MKICFGKTVNVRLIIKQNIYRKVNSFLQRDISKKQFNIKTSHYQIRVIKGVSNGTKNLDSLYVGISIADRIGRKDGNHP